MFIDTNASSDPLRRRLRHLTPGERREEAAAFIALFHRENDLPADRMKARRAEVLRALGRDGWYEHTSDELAFGARVAWRNSANCIGRLFWKSLEVIDCRNVHEPDRMAARLIEHLRLAHSGDRVPSIISIFASVKGPRMPPHVENGQLVQYAGYLRGDGGVLGDPVNVELTGTAMSLGWRPRGEPSAYDVLPLIVKDADGGRLVYPLPEDAYREVAITHPTRAALEGLGLRWYAVPVVSDMVLTIGGVDYPCAPFNGFYMATEIASRDLVDEVRYNLLEPIAEALGVDHGDALWKDETLTELNRAVLHSYGKAGVSICNHHAASDWYLTFVQTEEAASRVASGNWDWIVPPQASAACPVFHLPMTDHGDVPNFYRSRASDGAKLGVSRFTEIEGRHLQRFRRLQRRLRRWARERAR